MKFSSCLLLGLLCSINAWGHVSCYPNVETNRAVLFCKNSKKSFRIDIKKFVSPTNCSGPDTQQRLWSKVLVKIPNENKIEEFEVEYPDFTWGFKLGKPWYQSERYDLNLTECTSPSTGGFSIGN